MGLFSSEKEDRVATSLKTAEEESKALLDTVLRVLNLSQDIFFELRWQIIFGKDISLYKAKCDREFRKIYDERTVTQQGIRAIQIANDRLNNAIKNSLYAIEIYEDRWINKISTFSKEPAIYPRKKLAEIAEKQDLDIQAVNAILSGRFNYYRYKIVQ